MNAATINFPDENFKKYLVENFDKDGDGEISYIEALSITTINYPYKNVKSFAGIEFFTNLKEFYCHYNDNDVLDFSNNLQLSRLLCHSSNLKKLDITKCRLLKYLNCNGCLSLENLDLSNNILLEDLFCSAIGEPFYIDLTKYPYLDRLTLSFNSIKNVDLSCNPKLKHLNLRRCGLKKLDVSNLPFLEMLYCSENDLKELDLRKNTKLTSVEHYKNEHLTDIYLTVGHTIKQLKEDMTGRVKYCTY